MLHWMKAKSASGHPFGPLKNHYIREWRLHRGLSLRRLADRLADPAAHPESATSISDASLSRIERGLQPYNQAQLDALASALGATPADLLMRNPLDTEAPWTIWETLKPAQRNLAVRILKDLADVA